MKLFSYFKTPVIEFLCDARYIDVAPPPVPAGKMMPEWFKRIPPYLKNRRDTHDRKAMSAKKCLPMIDAMTLGFTIPLAADQNIRSNGDCSLLDIGPTSTLIDKVVERHSADQVGFAFGKQDPIKFINPWVVKTAPGWSSLFIPPINHFEDRFRVLGGMVDTDRYPKQVNFPAIWLKPNFDDFIPAGTPLVTVIPIKRGSMPTEANVRLMTEKEAKHIRTLHVKQQTRVHVYTNELREKR